MKTYTKQDFHNPEQLTRQQVGEEYRLLLPEEVDGRFSKSRGGSGECYPLGGDAWKNRECWDCRYTFRVPLATPLPDGTVLSSNECCWSDDVYAEVKAAHASGRKIEWRPTSESIWRDDEAEVPAWEGYGFEFRIKQEPCKKRVYVAGPMSNMPDYNFSAFYAAAESLEKQGYEPVNPAELDRVAGYTLDRIKQLDPVEFQEFLKGAVKRDLAALQQCDAIALMPGWENSKGARAEKAVAEWLGLEVMYLPGALNFERLLKHSVKPYLKYSDDPCDGETVKEGSGCANDSDKQPYNSDERAEWGVDALTATSTPQYAPDDPKGAAGALKAPMWLLPPYALQQTAWVHKHGAVKYLPYNWRETSVCATTYISAIMRHLDAWRDGDDNDPESGISHIAHVAASCNILLDAQHCGKLNDDRAKLK